MYISARSKHVEILTNRSDSAKMRACMKHGSKGVQIQRLLSVHAVSSFVFYMMLKIEKDHRTLTNKPQVASCRLKPTASQTSSLADVHVHIWSPKGIENSSNRRWETFARLKHVRRPSKVAPTKKPRWTLCPDWFNACTCIEYHRIFLFVQYLYICLCRVYTFQVSVFSSIFSWVEGGLCQWKTLSLLDLGCCLRCT